MQSFDPTAQTKTTNSVQPCESIAQIFPLTFPTFRLRRSRSVQPIDLRRRAQIRPHSGPNVLAVSDIVRSAHGCHLLPERAGPASAQSVHRLLAAGVDGSNSDHLDHCRPDEWHGCRCIFANQTVGGNCLVLGVVSCTRLAKFDCQFAYELVGCDDDCRRLM